MKTEVLSDEVNVEKGYIKFEIAVPTELLKEAIKAPNMLKSFIVREISEALDSFVTRKGIAH